MPDTKRELDMSLLFTYSSVWAKVPPHPAPSCSVREIQPLSKCCLGTPLAGQEVEAQACGTAWSSAESNKSWSWGSNLSSGRCFTPQLRPLIINLSARWNLGGVTLYNTTVH